MNYWCPPERQLVEAGLWERQPGYSFQFKNWVEDDIRRWLPNEQCADCPQACTTETDLVEHLIECHPAAWERWYWGRYREESAHRRLT